MSANSLYDNIRSYLRISSRVVSKTGSKINVGEKFTLKFTGSNAAYSASLVGKPRIVFDKARIYVEGTAYAKPVKGSAWYNLPDTELFPGESSSINVEFEAIKELGWWDDIWNAEHVAKVWIVADLDQDRFFQIWNYKDVMEEIEET